MSSQDASDVAKALAAFGAPAIRYHSFGQGAVKPSSVVLPRQEPAPAQRSPPVVLRQAEPGSLPEHDRGRRAAPPPAVQGRVAGSTGPFASPAPMPPMPAYRRTIDPSLVAARNAAGRPAAAADVMLAPPLSGPGPAMPAAHTGRETAGSGPKNLREIFAILSENADVMAKSVKRP